MPKTKKFRSRRRPTASSSSPKMRKIAKQEIQKNERGEAERFTEESTATILDTDVPVTASGTQLISIEQKSKLAIGSQAALAADRSGNAVEIHSLTFKFLLNANSAGSADQHVRILIVSTNTNVVPDIGSILNGVSGTSTLIADWVRTGLRSTKDNALSGFDGRYTKHYDRKHIVSAALAGPFGLLKFFDVKLRFPKGHKINYAGPSNTDFQSGMFFLFAIQNGASANEPTLSHILTYTFNN